MVIDDKLSGSQNWQVVYKKCIERVYHLRVLRNINIDCKILSLLYKSLIESVLCFSITTWYGTISGQQKNKLKKIVNVSSKLGADVTPLQALYDKYVLAQVDIIMKEGTHSLNNNYLEGDYLCQQQEQLLSKILLCQQALGFSTIVRIKLFLSVLYIC